jgi:hypothetical protein
MTAASRHWPSFGLGAWKALSEVLLFRPCLLTSGSNLFNEMSILPCNAEGPQRFGGTVQTCRGLHHLLDPVLVAKRRLSKDTALGHVTKSSIEPLIIRLLLA